MQKEFNYIIDNGYIRDFSQKLFFGEDPVTILPIETTMWDILVLSGIFQSKGQARKSGVSVEIPVGWTEMERGKLRHKIYILKPLYSDPAEDEYWNKLALE